MYERKRNSSSGETYVAPPACSARTGAPKNARLLSELCMYYACIRGSPSDRRDVKLCLERQINFIDTITTLYTKAKSTCTYSYAIYFICSRRASCSHALSLSLFGRLYVHFIFYLYIQGTFWWHKVILNIDRWARGLWVRCLYDSRRHERATVNRK